MRVIYVDDERPALDNFRLTVAGFPQIDQLHLFSDGQAALDFAMENTVDVAFLDMEMPGIHGPALAPSCGSSTPPCGWFLSPPSASSPWTPGIWMPLATC
ncbi:MAG: response regulator [Firmicutes bacterium]|nr:response regulator [Bacillota bacterium]